MKHLGLDHQCDRLTDGQNNDRNSVHLKMCANDYYDCDYTYYYYYYYY